MLGCCLLAPCWANRPAMLHLGCVPSTYTESQTAWPREAHYLGEVKEDLDGVGDDLHTGNASVAAPDEGEDDQGGSTLHQHLTALWRQPGGQLYRQADEGSC